ncbi:MAG: hypothetical protein ACK5O2_12125 [Microthrixaceae bacterium]
MTATVVDLFCGVGWALGASQIGIVEHGIDNNLDVATARNALGPTTTTADILDLDPADWAGVDGIIASCPPVATAILETLIDP